MIQKKESKNVKILLWASIILIGVLWGTNPPAKDALGAYLIFSVIGVFAYTFSDFRNKLIGINTKNIIFSAMLALGLGALFLLATKIIPGLSVGIPILPNAISDSLRFIIVVIFAPIVEEILFRGVILGFLLSITKGKQFRSIMVTSLLFAIAHLTAYVTGFYAYPNFTQGLEAFGANIASFIAAFLFSTVVSLFVLRRDVKNLVFAIVFHFIVNLIVFTTFASVFLF